jgi:EpsI family protein
MLLRKHRMLALNALLILTLAGSYWGRRIESATLPGGNFLKELNVPFRGWATQEYPLSPVALEGLEPDAELVRRYTSPDGQMAELAVLAGHRKKTVHTPAFCMLGDGWQVLSQAGTTLTLPNGKVSAARSVMTMDGRELAVTYFFTDGDYSTASLAQFQAVQLLKRFRSQVPLGALVRIIVPVKHGEPDNLTGPFAAETLPPVLAALKRERLHVP